MRFSNRPEKTLQTIFARVAVDSSIELGIVPEKLDVSGDGTCIKTGASPYGVKICDCKRKLKVDIPLSLRLVDAKRNDSVTAVVVLNEFRELYPNLEMKTFIHDAACDNYATYETLLLFLSTVFPTLPKICKSLLPPS